MFTRYQRSWISIGLGSLYLGCLLWLSPTPPDLETLRIWLLLTGLYAFTLIFGFPIAGGNSNLTPMVAVGGLLMVGVVPSAWMVFVGSLLYAILRARYQKRLGLPPENSDWITILDRGLASAVIYEVSLLVGYGLYVVVGGSLKLQSLSLGDLGRCSVLALGFFISNYFLLGGYIALDRNSQVTLRNYWAAFQHLMWHELFPQIFAPVFALIFLDLGFLPFGLFAMALVLVSLLMREQLLARQHLQQSLNENRALQALGQACARSLDQAEILAALYQELPRVMPARHFYVALYDANANEVTFPLYVEEGRVSSWPNRQAGRGLTEYVIRTRRPLVLRDDLRTQLKDLGVERVGRPAHSWVGVPIILGDTLLGVLVLQTLQVDEPPYTEEQAKFLVAIAAQLAMALHNAQLYRQTDQALAQRVQQLSSILNTTQEGIMLLDVDTRVVTANRSAAQLLDSPVNDLVNRRVASDPRLLEHLGLTTASLWAALEQLRGGQAWVKHHYTTQNTTTPREIERTLAGVQALANQPVAGWLIVLRDVSEEKALARLREDLAQMLIHDLRSPLGSILTSLAIMEQLAQPENWNSNLYELLRVAQESGRNMLTLINELLEIAQLESGQLPLQAQPAAPAMLIQTVVERLRPAAEAATVRLHTEVHGDLPELMLDVEFIRRVLINLTDNAIKFTPDLHQVTLWAKPEVGQVLFGISDEGPGLPPEAQAQLFKKFQRLPQVRGRRRGTGLGLAFCKLVIEAHRGRIWVESTPGAGSTFVFSLPVA